MIPSAPYAVVDSPPGGKDTVFAGDSAVVSGVWIILVVSCIIIGPSDIDTVGPAPAFSGWSVVAGVDNEDNEETEATGVEGSGRTGKDAVLVAGKDVAPPLTEVNRMGVSLIGMSWRAELGITKDKHLLQR